MKVTWDGAVPPDNPPLGLAGWCRVLGRGGVLGLVTFGGLALLLLVRLVERPLYGVVRPWTPFLTQVVCRTSFRILGVRYHVRGSAMAGPGAIVSNHVSWLDIFALNANKRIYFVAKSEVARWPGIGWLARATGTIFIRRDPRDARAHVETFVQRLTAGHKLLFFPEGTSTDGLRVLPFKPTLFESFFDTDLRDHLWVQPVTLVYRAGAGMDPRQYGWWGEMEFGPHLLSTLAARRQGSVTLIYHDPVRVADMSDRKALAKLLESRVRSGLQDLPPITP